MFKDDILFSRLGGSRFAMRISVMPSGYIRKAFTGRTPMSSCDSRERETGETSHLSLELLDRQFPYIAVVTGDYFHPVSNTRGQEPLHIL